MIALDQNNHTINLAKLNKIQLVKILFTILGSATQLLTISCFLFIQNWNRWSEIKERAIIVLNNTQRSKSLFVKSNYNERYNRSGLARKRGIENS
jgi:hypothetical protein